MNLIEFKNKYRKRLKKAFIEYATGMSYTAKSGSLRFLTKSVINHWLYGETDNPEIDNYFLVFINTYHPELKYQLDSSKSEAVPRAIVINPTELITNINMVLSNRGLQRLSQEEEDFVLLTTK